MAPLLETLAVATALALASATAAPPPGYDLDLPSTPFQLLIRGVVTHEQNYSNAIPTAFAPDAPRVRFAPNRTTSSDVRSSEAQFITVDPAGRRLRIDRVTGGDVHGGAIETLFVLPGRNDSFRITRVAHRCPPNDDACRDALFPPPAVDCSFAAIDVARSDRVSPLYGGHAFRFPNTTFDLVTWTGGGAGVSVADFLGLPFDQSFAQYLRDDASSVQKNAPSQKGGLAVGNWFYVDAGNTYLYEVSWGSWLEGPLRGVPTDVELTVSAVSGASRSRYIQSTARRVKATVEGHTPKAANGSELNLLGLFPAGEVEACRY